MQVGNQILIVVTMGNDVALVGQLIIFEIRCIETEKLSFADLLGITDKLVAILQGFVPGLFELGSGSLAFDDKQRLAKIVLNQNIGPATTGTPA